MWRKFEMRQDGSPSASACHPRHPRHHGAQPLCPIETCVCTMVSQWCSTTAPHSDGQHRADGARKHGKGGHTFFEDLQAGHPLGAVSLKSDGDALCVLAKPLRPPGIIRGDLPIWHGGGRPRPAFGGARARVGQRGLLGLGPVGVELYGETG